MEINLAREMMKHVLMGTLKKSLEAQGMGDVSVIRISDDFKRVCVLVPGKDGRDMMGVVRAEILLRERLPDSDKQYKLTSS